MSYAIVFYIVGWVLKFESYFLMLPLIVSLIYHENNFFAYLLVAAVCFLSGSLLTRNKPKNAKLYPRDGFVCVALSWILMSAFGAVPFVITGDIPSYVDALFETISGFTTTGASILTHFQARAYISLPLTTTLQSVTPSGWARFIVSLA